MNMFTKTSAGIVSAGLLLGGVAAAATAVQPTAAVTATPTGATSSTTNPTSVPTEVSGALPTSAPSLPSDLPTSVPSGTDVQSAAAGVASQLPSAPSTPQVPGDLDPSQLQALAQQVAQQFQGSFDPATFQAMAQKVADQLQAAGFPTDPATVTSALQAAAAQLQAQMDPSTIEAGFQQAAAQLQQAGLPLSSADAQAAFAQMQAALISSADQFKQMAASIQTAMANGLDPATFAAAIDQMKASMPSFGGSFTFGSKTFDVDSNAMMAAFEAMAQQAFSPEKVQALIQQFKTAAAAAGIPTDPAAFAAALQAAALEGSTQAQAAMQQVVDAIKAGADPAALQAQLSKLQAQLAAGGIDVAKMQQTFQDALTQLQGKVSPAMVLPLLISGMEKGATMATDGSKIDFAAFNQSLDTLIPALTQLGESLTSDSAPTSPLAPALTPVLTSLGLV